MTDIEIINNYIIMAMDCDEWEIAGYFVNLLDEILLGI